MFCNMPETSKGSPHWSKGDKRSEVQERGPVEEAQLDPDDSFGLKG